MFQLDRPGQQSNHGRIIPGMFFEQPAEESHDLLPKDAKPVSQRLIIGHTSG